VDTFKNNDLTRILRVDTVTAVPRASKKEADDETSLRVRVKRKRARLYHRAAAVGNRDLSGLIRQLLDEEVERLTSAGKL